VAGREVQLFEEPSGFVVQAALAAQRVPERITEAAIPQQAAADIFEYAEPMEDRGDLKAARQPEPVDPVGRQTVDARPVQ